MPKVVNIAACFEKFHDTYTPKIIGELNGQYVLAVKLEGDKCPWHTHEKEDEMFFVLEGILDVYDGKEKIRVHTGEFYTVYRGKEHRVVPEGRVKLLLFEPEGISHTGKVRSEITRSRFDRLDV
jgi:mannose-6-phosphate isomerase-like protein (cupin superfamily)